MSRTNQERIETMIPTSSTTEDSTKDNSNSSDIVQMKKVSNEMEYRNATISLQREVGDNIIIEEPAKKKRGRPRKQVPPPSLGDVVAVPIQNRKRGRPKTKAVLNVEASSDAPIEKKKRGRPRKQPSQQVDPSAPAVEKKKRGRPRIHPPKDSSIVASNTSGEKRKRGRPRKDPSTNGTGISINSLEKKKRGRPRKSGVSTNVIVTSKITMEGQNIIRDSVISDPIS